MAESDNYYGKGGRLTKSANIRLINTAYAHDCHDSDELLPGLHIADLVHVIGLYNAQLVPQQDVVKLIKALIEISEEKIEIKPELGDVYNSKEYALKQKIGDVAGWLHMGRARREAINNGFLIRYKTSVLALYKGIIQLCETFAKLSNDHVDTLMMDFTYMLHAQPTTLGHYLGTYLTPLTRNLQRFEEYYQRLNQSWAGIGSVNGSRLPIDRKLLSDLLGCDKPSIHTRDAMWMPDIINEGIFLLANLLGGLNRFVEELIVWNTHEFGYIDIDDSYARASVIMPQKKNPYPLAYLRGLTNDITGKLSSYMMIGKEPSGFPDNRIFVYGDIIRTYDKVKLALDMFSDFLATINWNKTKMAKSVVHSFAYATDLAEEISSQTKLDYKSSHTIVGKAIRQIRNDESLDVIKIVTNELNNIDINMSHEQVEALKKSINIKDISMSRKIEGGTSLTSMNQYLERINNRIKYHSVLHLDKDQQIKNIDNKINNHLKNISNEFPIFKSSF